MEFELWWLLALPLAFGLGWLASRIDVRQLKAERRSDRAASLAYFRGLNFLLSEHQDQAIDAFIEAVTADPDTVDLHFALGNLFRRRGEYERAVRVHQTLLARADLPSAERLRAQLALAQDFFRAGLLDRAETSYRALLGTTYNADALHALLQIHERTKEWSAAIDIAAQLEKLGSGSWARQTAHYWCEIALTQTQAGRSDDADAALQQALAVNPQAVRPRQLLAAAALKSGQHAAALEQLRAVASVQPDCTALVAADLATLLRRLEPVEAARAWMHEQLLAHPGVELLDAALALDDDPVRRAALALRYLQTHPGLLASQRALQHASGVDATLQAGLQAGMADALKTRSRYRCAACGFEARNHLWHCPACQGWETYPPRRTDELHLISA